jgi:lysophospholipase L1-like esterase
MKRNIVLIILSISTSLCAASPVRFDPEPEVIVRGEKVHLVPGKITPYSGGIQTAGNRMIDAYGTPRSAPDSLKPDSLRLRFKGRTLQKGKDYIVDERFSRIGLGPEPSFPLDAELEMDYVYRKRRIDSLIRTASGEEKLIKGIPHINIPQPPQLPIGAIRIANYFFDYGTPPDAPLEFSVSNTPALTISTHDRIPRTLAKLKAGKPVKIVCWGDSVTAGSDATHGNSYARLFERMLKKRFPNARITVRVVAVGGSNSCNWQAPKNKSHTDANSCDWNRVVAEKPDLITMEFVNDAFLTGKRFEKVYQENLRRIRELDAEWIVALPHFTYPGWMKINDLRNTVDHRGYVRDLKTFAQKHKLGIADASGRWAHLATEGIPYVILLSNSLNHPLDAGHRIYAEELLKNFEGTK